MLAGIGLAQLVLLPECFARARARAARPAVAGIREISRLDWPPAIVPDHTSIIDKGYSCLTDQFGRIALVDLKKADSPKLVGELYLKAKRMVDCTATRQRAYALTVQESASGDNQYELTTISLAPASEPSILSHIALEQFSEASSIAASADMVCVGGTATGGGPEVAIFSARGKSVEPSFITSFSLDAPVVRMDLQNRQLVVLEGGGDTQVAYVNLFYPQSPQIRKTTKLSGSFHVMTRSKDLLLVAGQPSYGGPLEAKTIILEPAPHAMQSVTLNGLSAVSSAASQKDSFYVLGESGNERRVIEFSIGKDLQIAQEQSVSLAGGGSSSGVASALAVQGRTMNIASGWQGVDVLALEKKTWKHTLTYAIPRFPASAVATWDDRVLLAGADLKLYDIARVDRPVLLQTIDTGGTIKSVAGAGVYVLCLSKSTLSLRRMDSLSEQISAIDITGQDMYFGRKDQTAYVLWSQEKKTTLTQVKAYSNKLVADKVFQLPAGFRRITGHNDRLLVCGLKDLALYQAGPTLDLIGRQVLEGFAIRDAAMSDELILVTAVDHLSRGFLFVLAPTAKELNRIGTTTLPQDGVAIACTSNQAVTIGRTPEGKDMVSFLDVKVPAMPQVVASFPSVEASSAVTIKESMAIVVGRGLEILSLG